ncbi:putative beta-lysine N-acetyltransferase [Fredinandcohnia quinoae]|uniref:Beta-lysine N-acetyltransferase n=1 Tax=Fredinandcohnia quinoae TaxID=2918902 RepID=A0AAW5EC52_9BACI|nr:putative beta-lysine N-acetyltransferase [Fredinandcohnia sp. SECRCQ15]MCH1626349.1 putative beta-lysine N-acetyltransferase [Fredinandcohnia sp. SECRCQ15]
MNESYSEQKFLTGKDYQINIIIDYFNKRLKVEDYRGNLSSINHAVLNLVNEQDFEKLIIKARKEHLFDFLETGFMLEAVIKQYFNGSDALFLVKYFTLERKNSDKWVEEDNILTAILKKQRDKAPQKASIFTIRKATVQDAKKLASLYQQIFKIYPTPLNNPGYIEKEINNLTIFFVMEDGDSIISAASAEINDTYNNAEITDCATLPSYRKHGLMKELIVEIEKELINKGIYCAYSIARALSYGMNACFNQLGYSYTGRLINNCNIYDKIEDMNVWVKDLTKVDAEY